MLSETPPANALREYESDFEISAGNDCAEPKMVFEVSDEGGLTPLYLRNFFDMYASLDLAIQIIGQEAFNRQVAQIQEDYASDEGNRRCDYAMSLAS